MSILETDAYRFALASALSDARKSVSLASAFITVPGIEWILKHVAPSVTCMRVLARWSCADLVSGASDLEVYQILKANGSHFYILSDLHAKAALVDNKILLLGSANITNSGLRLVPGGNREIGMRIDATSEDTQVINALFNEAIEVSPDLYDEFQEHVKRLKKTASPQIRPEWPTALLAKLIKGSDRLWVAELLWSKSPDKLISSNLRDASEKVNVEHDIALLGLEIYESGQLSKDDVRGLFLKSRAWQWLTTKLGEAANHELYFGHLTSLLHDALLDDPKPYRRDVKSLVVNLVTWISEIGQSSVLVDRPSHSQRLRLIS